MQHRMKEFQMSQEAMDKVLTENQVGHVATIGKDIAEDHRVPDNYSGNAGRNPCNEAETLRSKETYFLQNAYEWTYGRLIPYVFFFSGRFNMKHSIPC